MRDRIDRMNEQLERTLQEMTTTLPPDEVLRAAKRFFVRRNSIYAAFPEKEGPTFVAMRGQGGEEVIVGVAPADGGTRVTASTYMFDQQVARFFSTLPSAEAPWPNVEAAQAPQTPGAGGRPSPAHGPAPGRESRPVAGAATGGAAGGTS